MDDLYDFVAYKDTLNIYPPQGKVIFSQVSVIMITGVGYL